jgi:hypothetical protein
MRNRGYAYLQFNRNYVAGFAMSKDSASGKKCISSATFHGQISGLDMTGQENANFAYEKEESTTAPYRVRIFSGLGIAFIT